MKIIFLGTPKFSLPYLQILLKEGYKIVGVITQPDRPQGRHLKLESSPVKKMAEELKVPLFQPPNLKDKIFETALKKTPPDLGVVVAYGQIIPSWLLELPKYGVINVHPSLLPFYRGAAPIQRAIINGEKKTGVTIQLMNEGLDTGDILSQRDLHIESEDTAGILENKLSKIGVKLLLSTVKNLVKGRLKPIKQEEKKASYAPKINKEECQIEWREEAVKIKDLIRALNPEPGAYTFFKGKRLKTWEAQITSSQQPAASSQQPGTIVDIRKGLIVATGTEPLELTLVQPENRNKIKGVEFIRGYRPLSREKLGNGKDS